MTAQLVSVPVPAPVPVPVLQAGEDRAILRRAAKRIKKAAVVPYVAPYPLPLAAGCWLWLS
jgi:hypothetical protein